MRDGLERVFDLVKSPFGRENGCLHRSQQCAGRLWSAPTRESYLRDMIARVRDPGAKYQRLLESEVESAGGGGA